MDCGESKEFKAPDASNNAAEVQENVNNEGLSYSEDLRACFLRAPELFKLRETLFKNTKSKEDLELYKGHKFYHPSDCAASEGIVEDILTDNKRSLQLERIAKNKDCLKAHWNEYERVAVVPSLKGKTTQHMGIVVRGKCLLSPEEALFLLEKGTIEVEHNKMPMSVEEAYAVMLKGKLAVEKYEVYTHLSQQGFIVIHHQSRIGPSYLKVMNLSKKKKRKRKAEGSAELPKQKRLTFSGVFPSNLNPVNTENNFTQGCLNIDQPSNNNKFISPDTLKSHEAMTNANENMNLDMDLTNNGISSNFGDADSHASLVQGTVSNDDISSNFTEIQSHTSLEKETKMSSSKDQIKHDDDVEMGASGKDRENLVTFNNVNIHKTDKDKTDQIFEKEVETDKTEMENIELNMCMRDKDKIDQVFEKVSKVDNNEMEINEINVFAKDKQNKFDQILEKVNKTDNTEMEINKINACAIHEQNKVDQGVEKISETDNNEMKINEINACEKDKQNKVDQVIDKESEMDYNDIVINDGENGSSVTNVKESIIDIESVHNNKIDADNKVSFKSDNDATNEIMIEDRKSDINVEDSGSDYDDNEEYVSTDESIPAVCEGGSEVSLDVYSYSPIGQQNDKDLNIEVENVTIKPSKVHDEEVTLVRVMKKEKKPLAVIDLLSDEEDNSNYTENVKSRTDRKNAFEDSDEEIQVVDEVAGTASNKETSVSAIKLESEKLKTESSNVRPQFRPQMKYPDTFRKDMMCISRPFMNLLPLHCQPAKEAYVLYSKKSSQSGPNQPRSNRLWNSYKDLQEYQRQRREKQREKQRERREKQWNSFGSRSSGSFRGQNDTFFNQTPPFCPPEYPRAFDIERNLNSPAPSSRNFHPMNSERGGGLLPTPDRFNSPNQLPFSMNVHNLQNLSTTNPTAFVNEIQKTVYSVATNMISTLLNHPLNPINSHPAFPPAFNNSNFMNFDHHNNNFSVSPGMPSPMAHDSSDRNDFHPVRFPPEPSFFGERPPVPMNENPFMMENNWRETNNFPQRDFNPRGPSFPCKYRAVRKKRDWNDVKAAVEGTNLSDSGSDIEEVPINLNRFLHSDGIKPLVDPGTKLPVADCLKAMKLTTTANLNDMNKNIERYLPATLTLEISFDVYLPNTKYKRSEPGVPNFRIIVTRAADLISKYSELVYLQRKWNDGSVLYFAVVDHGDISFYSFNSVHIPELVPFDSLHQ